MIEGRPKVGDTLRFAPSAFADYDDRGIPYELDGTVVYVNEEHRYYTVEAKCHRWTLKESFKYGGDSVYGETDKA